MRVVLLHPDVCNEPKDLSSRCRGGYIDFFAGLPPPWQLLPLDSQKLHYEELTVRGSRGSSPNDNKEAVALLERGQVPVTDLITHRFPLSRIAQAFACVRDGEGLKVIVEPDLEDPVSNTR